MLDDWKGRKDRTAVGVTTVTESPPYIDSSHQQP